MILNLNSTVQPEMTSTLSHKRAICDEATCTCVLSHDQNFFPKNFDPPGSSNKTLSSSAPNKLIKMSSECQWINMMHGYYLTFEPITQAIAGDDL